MHADPTSHDEVEVDDSAALSLLRAAHIRTRSVQMATGQRTSKWVTLAPRWARDIAVGLVRAEPPVEQVRRVRFLQVLAEDDLLRDQAHGAALISPRCLRDTLGAMPITQYRGPR